MYFHPKTIINIMFPQIVAWTQVVALIKVGLHIYFTEVAFHLAKSPAVHVIGLCLMCMPNSSRLRPYILYYLVKSCGYYYLSPKYLCSDYSPFDTRKQQSIVGPPKCGDYSRCCV